MKLPNTERPQNYTGLYVIDFGEQCAIGYTAEEVAILFDSEQFTDAKAYKIHRAQPDGTMDLRGITRTRFNMESGMFFHCHDQDDGNNYFQQLNDAYIENPPPCRCQLQLALIPQDQTLIALIYPAEYDDEMGCWLGDINFNPPGPIDAGISQVGSYYSADYQIQKKLQLWPEKSLQTRSREELLATLNIAVQR
ncbi:MAG: hypothetical protein GY869_08800 [Planctomycetes bacterium]|nr:hypothetical protein [Planctomycetota bacterium]